MDPLTSALLLVGFQNELFSDDGGLRHLVDATRLDDVLERTVDLITALPPEYPLVVSTPLVFSEDYEELVEPEGMLATIRERRLYRAGSRGVEPVAALAALEARVLEVRGRRGFDAFSGTDLDGRLRARSVGEVFICGALTSLCVAATARAASDLGYRVVVLADCSAGRTSFEHRVFCDTVFPLYASVAESSEVLERASGEPQR